ncbi:DUF4912 domain-containing protein [Leptolyngbya sp. FACHB-321]|uniref:DUF4912 domain-containing protein n=1 Tax=Leptolyngbya sp. FACHB-321 TaxID=2692807 RepID=UPI001684EF97|nr:DUF4912 domain-containing protein [Leptolyngbya sp. FACHB-321]MBD2038725.1 DUF4912 domain-containing protein [Leptolyngbya sp. FACHB-321]
MTRLRKQETSIVSLTILFTLSFAASVAGGVVASKATAARPLAGMLMINPILGQTASTIAFPLPTNVPVGTSIRIGGSSGMGTINQALKQRFEQRFVGTKVELNTQGTGPAIKDLMDNNADLAAIGRTLMPQEKAQGLVAVPVSRHKIAIIVGAENPFKGGLTFEQFAKIFRGEIKDWAQVGGEPGPIRFIDRPGSSDTRQAFRNYPVFKQAPFVTGKTAQQLGQDSTSQVVEALKVSGIGYAIADQLKDYSNVRIVPINNTLPSNPKYPFSQPLIYVYKGPQPNLPAQAFLGYAAAPVSRQTIETARKEATASATNPDVTSPSPQETIPSPQPVSSDVPVPSTVAQAPSVNGDTDAPTKSWLWLLALPLLGSFVWWVLKNRDAESELAEPELEEDIEEGFIPPTVNPMPTGEPLTEASIVPIADVAAPLLGAIQPLSSSRLILVPRDCKNAYAYWEIPAEAQASLQQQGAQRLVIRLYDVTGIDIRRQPPESLQEFECEAQAQDRHLPIRTDDRTYLTELGYIAAEGRWLQVARSEPVHVPACPVAQKAIAPDAASDEIPSDSVVLADGTLSTEGAASPVIAVDRSGLYATADDNQLVQEPYATSTALQTGEIARASAWYDESEDAASLTADTIAKGEVMDGMVWHRSLEAIASETPNISETPEPVFAASALAERTIADSSQPTSQSQLMLIPRADQALYVYWEADQAEKDALKQQGGQQMVLRVYAATGTGNAFPQSVQQYFCNDWDQDQHVSVPVSNLEYIAELGYMALDGRFLMLARSTPTWVPGA